MRPTKAVPAEVPAAVADLNLLDRIDYQDAFVVDTAVRRAPEQWMRWFLEGAPAWFRASWPGALKTLGAQFEPRGTADQVLGWKILQNGPAETVVGLDATIGLKFRLIALTPIGQTMIATLVSLDTRRARALWVAMRPLHRFFARYLLSRAAAIAIDGSRPGGPAS
jgi:hypothetical protein